jgi:hypothetical protein
MGAMTRRRSAVGGEAGPRWPTRLRFALASFARFIRHQYQSNYFPSWLPTPAREVEGRFPVARRTSCTGPAGTVVLCDATGLHRGGHVISGHRLIFYALYSADTGRPRGPGYSYDRVLGAADESLRPPQKYAVNPGAA